jgi:uncharacterized protein DUF5658
MRLLSETNFEMSHYPRELMVDKHESICETTSISFIEGRPASAKVDVGGSAKKCSRAMDFSVAIVCHQSRRQADRRRYPTTFWSALRCGGRRKKVRRSGEAYRVYVDCPSRDAVLLLSFVLGASLLDALLTLLFIQNGGSEANPVMSAVLNFGQTPFIGIKMALTGLGAWLLVVHQYFPMAYRGLLVLAGSYMGVLLMHASILLS